MYLSKFKPGRFDLRIKRSPTGLGLFTYDRVKKGACVIEYKGRRISEKEQFETNSKYLFEVSKKITIDGASRQNKARYINHACLPNCEIEIYRGHVYVMAKKNIKAGEELTYDYDKEYWEEYIKPKGCRCGKCANFNSGNPA
jgi:SET domain-containing protein